MTGSQYPGEMVWPLSSAEHLAIPGSWPSKADIHGLKEEASPRDPMAWKPVFSG